MALEDFRGRFRTVDLCRVKRGQLKERNVLRATEASDAEAEASVADDNWLADIPGASRAEHTPKAPSKKKSKSKKKHKKKSKR